jgi:hypothetical protein
VVFPSPPEIHVSHRATSSVADPAANPIVPDHPYYREEITGR